MFELPELCLKIPEEREDIIPVPDYGVLKGRPTSREVRGPHGKPPHLHIKLTAGGDEFDIAVNILSTDGSEILYHVNHALAPQQSQGLLALPAGRTLLNPDHALALDFIRQNLVKKSDMMPLQARDARQLTESDLHNEIDDMVFRAISDPDAHFFAFGSKFPEGIHDIHMNQGNPEDGANGQSFHADNGTYQDGALLAFFPDDQRWLAAFIAFQSQSWNNDNDGNPVQ